MRKFFILLFSLLLIVFVSYLFRAPILRQFAEFLIKEDSLQKADAMFVLSGAGYDRGNEAAKIFREGFTSKIICTGANQLLELRSFKIDTLESEVTIANLKRCGIADSLIVKIPEGTSTREESNTILKYCLKNSFKKIILVSSKLHTRRVKEVFCKKFNDAGIQLIIRGSPSSTFDEMYWWQSEDGMIAVNNEWMKTFYYWCKY